MAPIQSSETSDNTELLLGGNHCISATLKAGQVLTRGAVLGIDPNGKYVHCDYALSDGSQNGRAVLVTDVDSTGADKETTVAVDGEFEGSMLNFANAGTLQTSPSGTTDTYEMQLNGQDIKVNNRKSIRGE